MRDRYCLWSDVGPNGPFCEATVENTPTPVIMELLSKGDLGYRDTIGDGSNEEDMRERLRIELVARELEGRL